MTFIAYSLPEVPFLQAVTRPKPPLPNTLMTKKSSSTTLRSWYHKKSMSFVCSTDPSKLFHHFSLIISTTTNSALSKKSSGRCCNERGLGGFLSSFGASSFSVLDSSVLDSSVLDSSSVTDGSSLLVGSSLPEGSSFAGVSSFPEGSSFPSSFPSSTLAGVSHPSSPVPFPATLSPFSFVSPAGAAAVSEAEALVFWLSVRFVTLSTISSRMRPSSPMQHLAQVLSAFSSTIFWISSFDTAFSGNGRRRSYSSISVFDGSLGFPVSSSTSRGIR
mmetsp:Transcript_7024/g.12657  ORF Transcript_7024/g.12657 Transcript_7024/m.12657 type:complete len:274 (-) Transcript_7024:782-1603(-)